MEITIPEYYTNLHEKKLLAFVQYYYYNMLMGLLIVQPPEAVERDLDGHMPLQKRE